MKKIITTATALAMTLTIGGLSVSAADATSASVYVTISDANGSLVMTQQQINVTDIDSDGILTVNDALYCAHEASYEGGAAAGYAISQTEYGLSLDTLWGTTNGGSYGYCVNNSSAMSLSDEIANGDYINAYVYTDLTAWSDVYCYFDENSVSAEENSEIALNLSYIGYDDNWNPVSLAVSGAVITINGEETEYVTGENGDVTVIIETAGDYVISAKSATQTLVPPACKASVTAAQEIEEEESLSEFENESVSEFESTTHSPNTGVGGTWAMGALAVALTACAAASHKKRG